MNEISPALDMYIEYRTLNKQYFPHIPRDSKVSAKHKNMGLNTFLSKEDS